MDDLLQRLEAAERALRMIMAIDRVDDDLDDEYGFSNCTAYGYNECRAECQLLASQALAAIIKAKGASDE